MSPATTLGERAAAVLLVELLERPGSYRRLWVARADRDRSGTVNRSAVARVLASLDATGPRADALKHRVHRVFDGHVSAATLRLFIEAFRMTERDAELLWVAFAERSKTSPRVVSGALRAAPATAAALGPVRHRTRSLHEHHYVGADRLPQRHRTVHVIEALEDGVDRYPFRFDTDAATVRVRQGGVATPPYRVDDMLRAVDILLPEPLPRGGTASLEYEVTFDYAEPPPPRFRRAALRRTENVDIRVEFAEGQVPTDVWWAEWASLRSDDLRLEERVDVAPDRTVHRYLSVLENAAVGFRWRW